MTRIGSKNLKGTDTETEARRKTETGKAKRKDIKIRRGCGYHTVIEQQMGKQAEKVRTQTRSWKDLKVKTMKGRKRERRVNIEKGRRTERDTTKTGTTLTEQKAKGETCRLFQHPILKTVTCYVSL